MVAFSQIESQLPLLTRHTMGFGPVENGYLFMYVGMVIVVFQLTGTRWLSTRLGDERLIVLRARSRPRALRHDVVAGAGSGRPHRQCHAGSLADGRDLEAGRRGRAGAILGASQSLGSSGRIVGPVLGGALFAEVAPPAPYLAGGVAFAVIAAAFVVLDRRVT